MAVTLTTSTSITAQAIELDSTAQEIINRLRTLRTQTTELEKEKALLRDQVLFILGDAEVGTIEGVVRVRQREELRRSIDYAKLQEFPDVYEAVVSKNSSVKLDIK
jgi:predicted phage-related endonuclease